MNNDNKKEMSMKRVVSIVAVLVLAFTTIIAQGGCLPVNVTVKVVDDENKPVSQADVEMIFTDARQKEPGKGWGIDAKYDKRKGVTDANGLFSASGATNFDISVSAEKSGYYKSSGGIAFYEGGNGKAGNNTVVLTFRKKNNPVPMYAKKTNAIKMPAVKQPLGYDVEKGDWVAPFGKGVTSDFIFTIDYEIPKNARVAETASLALAFSNDKDGIQEYNPDIGNQSVYIWPYEAPLDGYLPTIEKHTALGSDRNLKQYANYIFRVRTKTDKKGNILEAKYGKITGEIRVGLDGYIVFSFYFNPDGTRNLEFDTEKNLFIPEGAKKWKEQYDNFTGFAP
jgi:hypothetical protein